jgi:hypothetical protein
MRALRSAQPEAATLIHNQSVQAAKTRAGWRTLIPIEEPVCGY